RLAALAGEVPVLEALRERLAATLDADGRVRDGASPALARARRGIADGERALHRQLERWAAGHGPDSYVTRAGERFVVLVPAAGFSRRQGIVHDTSGSGQSLFVEPLETCEANNRLIELRAEAAEEERRILRELAAEVRRAAPALETLERTLAMLDALRACAAWAVEFGGVAITPGGAELKLVGARHPLLVMNASRSREARGGEGDAASAESPEVSRAAPADVPVSRAAAPGAPAAPAGSTRSAIVPLDLALGEGGRLLLADELGAGTAPEEGAALGRALIEHVAARGAWGVITTHLGSLKRVAGEVPGVVNGSLEFDLDTLTSRFRFRRGVPGASHAL